MYRSFGVFPTRKISLGFYRDSIFLWPKFDNGMRSICVDPKEFMGLVWKIFVRDQDNLWGLHENYL